jgi:uncharacterized membrane protein
MFKFTNMTPQTTGEKFKTSQYAALISGVVLMIFSLSLHAQYSYQFVNYPGSLGSEVWGINEAGKAVGSASNDGVSFFAFEYDIKKGKYTLIPELDSALDMNNSGESVSSENDNAGVDVCVIRDKKGNVTPFFPPSAASDPTVSCSARGISSDGMVAGFEIGAAGWTGFVYDSVKGTFEEFLPTALNEQTIAHGINAKGQIVGNVRYRSADAVYPGSPPGRYAFRREADGSVKFFTVNGNLLSRARGISANGKLIAGFFNEVGATKGYVSGVSKGSGFEDVAVPDGQILYQSPCSPDSVSPGEDWVLFTSFFAQGVRNDGTVAGSCWDDYVLFDANGQPIDFSFNRYGYIATPE